MYKIRSMRHDAEAATGAVWATRGDRRVTRLGRFLRRTHVDELPQLWNVVRGEMCLIGPRPERPEIVARLVAEIPDFTDRLVVRPGITGLAQVQLSPDVDLDSVQRKLIVDCWYIHNAGWRLDLKIAVCTFLQLLHVPVAMSHRLCRINRIVNQLSHVPLDSPSATPHRRAA
jgi:lipopolysaccharide/colanic/teichoic acid biosynthesis glycosyltransferase